MWGWCIFFFSKKKKKLFCVFSLVLVHLLVTLKRIVSNWWPLVGLSLTHLWSMEFLSDGNWEAELYREREREREREKEREEIREEGNASFKQQK